MFVVTENIFIGLLKVCTIKTFDESLASNFEGSIKCVPLNNRPCQARPTLANCSFNESLLYSFTVSVNKCGGSCDTIYDPYVRVYPPGKVKNMNVKLFHLVLGLNETRSLIQHESC